MRDLFLGLRGVYYIWHGEWADPEIEYYGKLYNYWDVVDAMIEVQRSFDNVVLRGKSDDAVWAFIVRLNYRTKLMIFKEAIYSIQGY
jgi:hypothetical protein